MNKAVYYDVIPTNHESDLGVDPKAKHKSCDPPQQNSVDQMTKNSHRLEVSPRHNLTANFFKARAKTSVVGSEIHINADKLYLQGNIVQEVMVGERLRSNRSFQQSNTMYPRRPLGDHLVAPAHDEHLHEGGRLLALVVVGVPHLRLAREDQ